MHTNVSQLIPDLRLLYTRESRSEPNLTHSQTRLLPAVELFRPTTLIEDIMVTTGFHDKTTDGADVWSTRLGTLKLGDKGLEYDPLQPPSSCVFGLIRSSPICPEFVIVIIV